MPHTKFPMPMVDERICVRCETRDYSTLLPIPLLPRKCIWCSGDVESTGKRVPAAHMPERNQLKVNRSKRLIGFEIELDRADNGEAIDAATKKLGGAHVHDGSCGSGLEICTPPAGGDLFIDKIKTFSTELRAAGAKCGPGLGGAGLHTHIDCRDMSYQDMRKIAIVYSILEPAIYSILPPSRITAQYSKPIGPGLAEALRDPSTAKLDFIKLVEGEPNKSFRSMTKEPKGNGNRYLGANFHSWFLRGTIEFRLHAGTTKWEKMIPFGLLMCSLVEKAVAMREKDLWNVPNGKAGLHFIAPDISLKICDGSPGKQYDAKKDGVRQWIDSRWDFFANSRKRPNEPVLKYE